MHLCAISLSVSVSSVCLSVCLNIHNTVHKNNVYMYKHENAFPVKQNQLVYR